MRVYRHYANLPASARGLAVAVGNFDGVHRGHRSVLDVAAARARDLRIPLGVLTFVPHPRRFFQPDIAPFQITSLRTKLAILDRLGVDVVYALRFDAALAGVSAQEFIDHILVKALSVRCVVTGRDFMFGRGRGGDHTTLSQGAFDYTAVAMCETLSGTPYASTRIRACLRDGDMPGAAALLGRMWCVEGRVITGAARGRSLGFPTANMGLADCVPPAAGVYAVQVGVDKARGGTLWHDGVANYGRRPTFGDGTPLLEVHILDFDDDLYGQRLCVRFVAMIRREKAFSGPAALRTQIGDDCQHAREILVAHRDRIPGDER